MSTTPYAAPTITAAGLSVSPYSAIQQFVLNLYQSIYGSTTYLGVDSADFQFNSAFAQLVSDVTSLLQVIYNQRSPTTAIGSGLDSILKLNGVARIRANSSFAVLDLTGTPNYTITNGMVTDSNGFQWLLLPAVTLSNSGTATATAMCQTAGAISANPGSISTIFNQQSGWTSATNPNAAVVGNAVEQDSHVRARQAISVALPSLTIFQGTLAGLEAIPGIGRVSGIENSTSATDAFGNTAKTIALIVELGDATEQQVAQAIFDNRGLGCATFSNTTNGATPVTINIPVPGSSSGLTFPCNFAIATYKTAFVSLSIKRLTGYTGSTPAAIQAAIVAYVAELASGEGLTQSALYWSAMGVMPNQANPSFSITAVTLGTSATPTGTADLPALFGAIYSTAAANVVVTVT